MNNETIDNEQITTMGHNAYQGFQRWSIGTRGDGFTM